MHNFFVTAIDLGSNSFRVVQYDYENNHIINEYHEVVGMAQGLAKSGKISKEAQQRVLHAIQTAAKQLSFEPSAAVCVTTAAMRMASNSQEVLKNFQEQTGAKFKIIDAQTEAQLILLAIKYALKRENIQSDKFIILDIGGGSTELVIHTNGESVVQSFPFGIVTLTQKHADVQAVKKELICIKQQLQAYIQGLNINLDEHLFVSTAGTPTTVAAVKLGLDAYAYDKNRVNGSIVEYKDLEIILKRFENEPLEKLTKLVGSGRVEFIEVGILIFKMVFEVLNKNKTTVFDDGLREGVAINHVLKQVVL
jgi:exopolyphosphatase/guanosine-5'-triphosphate,3'-diphosphate pyrophosphatase